MEVNIRERNNIIIFDIINKDIVYDGDSLLKYVKGQLDRGKRNLLLNFDNVDFVDDLVVGEIMASFVSTQNVGGKIKLQKIRPKIRSLLGTLNILNLLEVFDDEEAAIKSFF